MRLIRRVRPHIVHTHTAKAGAVGRLAALLCGVPVVVHTFHGHVLRGYFSPAKTAVYRAIERGLARRTDRLLTVTDRVRDELLALGVGRPEQSSTVPLGFDLAPLVQAERRRGELRAELGLGTAPLVGIVARLVPIKAHEVFLDAAARIRRRRPTRVSSSSATASGARRSRPGSTRWGSATRRGSSAGGPTSIGSTPTSTSWS